MVKVKIFNDGINKLPSYAKEHDAGFDLMADFSQIFENDAFKGNGKYYYEDRSLIIFRGGRVLIPTLNHVAIPVGYEIQVRPRSGLALKYGITILNTPGTIDSSYRDGIGIILFNNGEDDFIIRQGDRIAQGVLNKIEEVEWLKVGSIEELGETERGMGGFGHSGV